MDRRRSGSGVDHAVDTEEEAFDAARRFLSYLPGLPLPAMGEGAAAGVPLPDCRRCYLPPCHRGASREAGEAAHAHVTGTAGGSIASRSGAIETLTISRWYSTAITACPASG